MSERYRSDYVLLEVSEMLGPHAEAMDVEWAEFVGDKSSELDFEVPTADARDGYVTIQALDVSEYGHEVVVNGEPLTGFDLPPHDGWQTWMDVISGPELVEGTNTLRFRRDEDSRDSFVIGSVRVTWREPVE